MEEISKARMMLANRRVERLAAKVDDVPTFRGVPATAFDKEHLVMLCTVFANEWHTVQKDYYSVLMGAIPTYKERARKTLEPYNSPKPEGEAFPAFHTKDHPTAETEELIEKLREAHKNTIWIKPLPKPSIWRRIWNRIKSWA